ncbi:MAG: hypothetical protein QG670_2382 [Thermoproteota archaeon]|nr:hypothetical protein [Thermoproteota archaeon]
MNDKGISTVLATLMMIIVAVAGSLVTYAWVMGYLNFTTNKAGNAIQIQSISNEGAASSLTVYVQNVGQTTVTLATSPVAYLNGLAQPVSPGTVTVTVNGATTNVVPVGSTATIVISNGGVAAGSGALVVKVQANDGSFTQNTFYP